ncbi:MAG: hypothetical protein M3Z75_30825 [Actinomycetota bacterium]|nr:hypothetical protein [Actinomycetota bacterium]
MAFPRHRSTTGARVRGARDGREIGGGEPEARVGANCEAQCRGGAARVSGSLRFPVPFGRAPSRGDRAAVDLNRGPGDGQLITVTRVLG